MLDVHPPHSSIGNASEFFLHLFTITVGLLIAVGIEAGVERYHHHELAESARETLNAEIRHNASEIGDALRSIAKEQAAMKHNLEQIARVQVNPKDPMANDANLDATYASTGLEDTAWKTAEATSALTYMNYDEASKYSSIYDLQQDFAKQQEKLADDASSFFGLMNRYHIDHGGLTREAADAFAERIGIWQGHLLQVDIAAKVLQEQQNAFLQGREPKHHMSESFSN